ncbi:MAG: pilus assembly protein PilP [Pseudomonadota bacterium]
MLIALLSGCGSGEHEDVKRWMSDSSRDLRGRVPPLPELRPFPIVSYETADLLDPFNAGRIEPEKKDGGGKKPDFDRPREQLESFPLESLQFIGVVSKNKGGMRYALIQVDNVVYQAGKGNYVGQNFGYIVDITDNEVMLIETVQDPTGQSAEWVERPATLQLQEGTQGKEADK